MEEKKKELPHSAPYPPPSCAAAGCDQRESIGHFSPIAPLLQTSRACNNVQMSSSVQCPLCETITTGCSAVSELQQCSPTHLTLPLRWELPPSWGRSRMAAPKYHTTKSTSTFNISAVSAISYTVPAIQPKYHTGKVSAASIAVPSIHTQNHHNNQ